MVVQFFFFRILVKSNNNTMIHFNIFFVIFIVFNVTMASEFIEENEQGKSYDSIESIEDDNMSKEVVKTKQILYDMLRHRYSNSQINVLKDLWEKLPHFKGKEIK